MRGLRGGGAFGPGDARFAQLLHDFAVVRLGEEGADAVGDDGADVGHLQQFVFAGVHHALQRAEVAGQVARGAFAHVAYAQGVEKALQRALARALQRSQQVAGRALAHALQRGEALFGQFVEVGQGLDDAAVHELLDQFVAQPFHVHGAAAGKVPQGLLALGGAGDAAGAAVIGFAFFAHGLAVAHGALGGHGEFGRASGASLGHDAHHFGDDVACAADDDGVAHAHVFAARFQFVVQGGVGDGDAADEDGGQFGHGGELAGAAHLHVDGQHGGHLLLRGVFVRHGPARLARGKAQLALLRERVHFVDHAVNVKRQAVALRGHFGMKGGQPGSAARLPRQL